MAGEVVRGVDTGWASVIIGLVGLVFAFLAWRASRRAVRVSEKQLELAEDQDARRPLLLLANAKLGDPTTFEEVKGTVELRREWVDKLSNYEAAKKRHARRLEEEKEKKKNFYENFSPSSNFEVAPIDPRTMPAATIRDYSAREYDGPLPDKVLTFNVVNKGRVAARDYSLKLWLGGGVLHPFSFPGLNSAEAGEPNQEGFYELEPKRYFSEAHALHPGDQKGVSYQIAVLVNSPGRAVLRYELTTSQGDLSGGKLDVEVP